MSGKQNLFDSDVSEDELEEMDLNFGNKYATQYNDWRRKEEMQRLKDKYGDNLDIMSEIEGESGDEDGDEVDDSDSESSNVESEDEEFDAQFATVLAALKKKDPKIYDKNFTVQKNKDDADEEESDDEDSTKKSEHFEKKMTLPEYHKKLLKEKKGITEEDEGLMDENYDDDNKPAGYYQELQSIRKEINDIANEGSDDEDDNMFSVKQQITPSTSKAPKATVDLSEIWNGKKKIDKSDAFLRDYIVNKRYAESAEDVSRVKVFQEPSSHFGGFENYNEEELGDEEEDEEKNDNDNKEETISKKATQGVNVPKYHFEEPDATVIKRFPRNVQSVRDTIQKETKTKRAETREKKKLEKESELKKLRRLKREEMESRIAKLREISGNSKLDIKDLDLNVIVDDDAEFDLEKYDEKMNALFGNDYYNVEEDSEKPEFAYCEGIDDDLYPDEEEIPKCVQKNKKWKSKKESKKLDIMKDDDIGIYEDLIGGEIATRFRYRMVETNDFGLTDEEILFADEKELNRWCSLKKMSQYRSKGEEEHDKKSFQRKKDNMELKRRILKSLYGEEATENPIIRAFSKGNEMPALEPPVEDQQDDDEEKDEDDESKPNNATDGQQGKKKKNRRRGKKKKATVTSNDQAENSEVIQEEKDESMESEAKTEDNVQETLSKEVPVQIQKSNRKRKRPQNNNNHNRNNNNNSSNHNKNNIGNSGLSEARLKAYGMSKREIKRVKL